MPNAKNLEPGVRDNILLAGNTGSGKTSQIWTLPGKKFAYIFDPNALESLVGCDLEYETFLPAVTELDASIKKFNRDARPDDKSPVSNVEPVSFVNFVKDINDKYDSGYFDDIDWIIFDSLTYLARACMDRQMWINRRFGALEDLADYRIVGSKLSDVFRPITSMEKNIFCTGHITEYQDEKTKAIITQLMLPGSARTYLPLMFTNIWEAQAQSTEKEEKYVIKTRPEQRGLKSLRSTKSLELFEDVTIKDFSNADKYGIGALLRKGT